MTTVQKQRQLQLLGYYKGNIDGLWGKQSEAATREFQAAHGLVVDGKFGAKTETKTMQLIIDIQRMVGAKVDGLAGSETITKYNAYMNAKKETATDNGDWWNEIKYFDRSEFKCKCGKYCNGFPVEPDKRLVKLLDNVRAHFGKPTTINSGIRCKQHNANEGGAAQSQHLYGTAADIRVDDVAPKAVYAYLETLLPNTGGVGLYDWGCHVDVRTEKARWNG